MLGSLPRVYYYLTQIIRAYDRQSYPQLKMNNLGFRKQVSAESPKQLRNGSASIQIQHASPRSTSPSPIEA